MITFFTSNTTLTFPVKCVVIIKNSHCDQRNNTRMPHQTKKSEEKREKYNNWNGIIFQGHSIVDQNSTKYSISTSNVI